MERQDLLHSEPHADQAIKKLLELMQKSAEGSDDEMSELVDEIHPRAVTKVHEFLNYLVQQSAWCGLEFGASFFRYKDIDQLRLASNRLVGENIKEFSELHHGSFTGILPNDRTFEFTVIDSDLVIKGKIALEFDDPAVLLREFYQKPMWVDFDVVQVGNSRPRFRLSSIESLHQEKPD